MPRGQVLSEAERTARNAEKQERFYKTAGQRVYNILEGFRRLSQCSTPTSYAYTPEQVDKMRIAIENAARDCFVQFSRAPETKKKSGFEF